MIRIQIFLGIILSVLVSSWALAYEFKNPQAAAFSQAIENSLNTAEPEGISSSYSLLARSETPISDLIELRFQMQIWRKTFASTWIQELASPNLSIDQYLRVIKNLDQLSLKFSQAEIRNILEHRPSLIAKAPLREEIEFLGNQAEPGLDLGFVSGNSIPRTGPSTLLDITPVHRSEWIFDKWKNDKNLTRYEFTQDGVLFRGIELRSGDLILTDFSINEGSLFSSINGAEALLSHLAMVVILEEKTGKLPVVIDMFGFGLRAIPLNVFLSPGFSSYSEIYRLKNPPENLHEKLGQVVSEMLAGKKGKFVYDMTWTSCDPKALTCAKLGNYVYKEVGVAPVEAHGVIYPSIIKNLKPFGLNFSEFLSPGDYVRDPRFSYIGVIDNGFVLKDIAKQVSAYHMAEFLGSNQVCFKNLPKEYLENREGIAKSQDPSWLVSIYMHYKGFSGMVTIPQGSPDFLAFIPIFSKAFGRSVVEIENQIQTPMGAPNLFSIHDYQERDEIQALFNRSADQYREWFCKP